MRPIGQRGLGLDSASRKKGSPLPAKAPRVRQADGSRRARRSARALRESLRDKRPPRRSEDRKQLQGPAPSRRLRLAARRSSAGRARSPLAGRPGSHPNSRGSRPRRDQARQIRKYRCQRCKWPPVPSIKPTKMSSPTRSRRRWRGALATSLAISRTAPRSGRLRTTRARSGSKRSSISVIKSKLEKPTLV